MKYWVPRWSFYEKPMKSQYVLMKDSAMGEKMKVTTLTQEVIRRLRNTSREAEDKEREEVLTKFAVKSLRLQKLPFEFAAGLVKLPVAFLKKKKSARPDRFLAKSDLALFVAWGLRLLGQPWDYFSISQRARRTFAGRRRDELKSPGLPQAPPPPPPPARARPPPKSAPARKYRFSYRKR